VLTLCLYMEDDVRSRVAARLHAGEFGDTSYFTVERLAEDSLEMLTLSPVRIDEGHASPPGIPHLDRRLLEQLTFPRRESISWNTSPLERIQRPPRRNQSIALTDTFALASRR
jgi:hypothetical protein